MRALRSGKAHGGVFGITLALDTPINSVSSADAEWRAELSNLVRPRRLAHLVFDFRALALRPQAKTGLKQRFPSENPLPVSRKNSAAL